MIKQLKNKVFLIIMISVSIVLVGIILLFAYSNYSNTINSATALMDRFNDFSKAPKTDNANEIGAHIGENRFSIDLSNTYAVMIEEGIIIDNTGEKDEKINEYALKAYNQSRTSGIVENYVYKVRNVKEDNTTMVILMQNDEVVSRIKSIYIITIFGCLIAIIIIFVISKKLSNMIVMPVEETIEKQKQFISDASHELKTPLAVIEANAEVLENEIGKSKWMSYIQSEISSMNKLINDLLFLTKVENVQTINIKEVFNISEEVNMVCSMFESMAYEKSVKIKYDIDEDLRFNGNKEDIKQVLSILIDNAIMHTKENGEVTVRLKKDKNNTIIQVENEGEPIPDSEINKIFERFYRVDKSRNRNEKRYGLGLAIAKSIVEQYNGKIEVLCKGGITCFKIVII